MLRRVVGGKASRNRERSADLATEAYYTTGTVKRQLPMLLSAEGTVASSGRLGGDVGRILC